MLAVSVTRLCGGFFAGGALEHSIVERATVGDVDRIDAAQRALGVVIGTRIHEYGPVEIRQECEVARACRSDRADHVGIAGVKNGCEPGEAGLDDLFIDDVGHVEAPLRQGLRCGCSIFTTAAGRTISPGVRQAAGQRCGVEGRRSRRGGGLGGRQQRWSALELSPLTDSREASSRCSWVRPASAAVDAVVGVGSGSAVSSTLTCEHAASITKDAEPRCQCSGGGSSCPLVRHRACRLIGTALVALPCAPTALSTVCGERFADVLQRSAPRHLQQGHRGHPTEHSPYRSALAGGWHTAPMTTLITGGAGYVGGHTVVALHAARTERRGARRFLQCSA